MTDENPQPDPGNSPPENWTEELTLEEQVDANANLEARAEEKASEVAASEAGRDQADFEVVDGVVVPVNKSVEFIEPAPVEYRRDEDVAKDAAPIEEATPDDGSSSSDNSG
jgi:hypothetical protein